MSDLGFGSLEADGNCETSGGPLRRLYKAASTNDARHIIDIGFRAENILDMDDGTVQPVVIFRDLPPTGLALSRTTEIAMVRIQDEDRFYVNITGGPILDDYIGDFIVA